MLNVVFLLALAVWSIAVGTWLVRRFVPASKYSVDDVALALPLGLGVLSLATLVLGELGVLSRSGLAVVGLIGVIPIVDITLRVMRCRAPQRANDSYEPPALPRHAAPDDYADEPRPSRLIGLVCDAALVLTLLGTFLTALAPVTDGDALCYHLQVPKIFLQRHSVTFEPDLHETIYPLVTEMLYSVALAFRGSVACRLVQWLLGVSLALTVTALARPILGTSARWAATIVLLVPAISNGMGAPLNDVALAAFANAALLGWVRWRERPNLGSALLAGALAGFSLGVKYPGLVWVGLLGLVTVILELRQRWSDVRPLEGEYAPYDMRHEQGADAPRSPLIICHLSSVIARILPFALAALLVGGVWYLRAYVHTGNPVFPFFRHVFGGAGIDDVLDPIKRPLPVTPWNLVTALVPLTLDPNRFDSVSHQFGPAFLLLLPALLLVKAPKRLLALVVFGWAFMTVCLTQRQSMRFMLAALGPLSVGVAWLAANWREQRSFAARALLGMIMLMLGFEASLSLVRARHGIGVILGRESADSYLRRREPTYEVGLWMAKNLPSSARIIGQDHRGFYLPRPYSMELAHRRRTGLGEHRESADRIISTLCERGFTHLLLCPPIPEAAVEFDGTLSRKLEPWVALRAPVFRKDITDGDGVTRRYALYDLSCRTSLADAGRSRE
jgi:hypothetical protein